ncbi:MAG TPA: gamma-glutamyltransferase, partial [Acetobacteraceae bacterium]
MPDPAYLFGPARARRPNVLARRHVVVSGHYYASLAGLQILEAGGNAIDAGVATGLAIDVLESEFVGFGGVAPAMIHLGERDETHVISGVGVWPKAADLEFFHRNHGGRIPEGLLHCVVPAAASIWIAALERFGTMSFGEVAAAAIRFAREGFPTYPFLAEQLAARQQDFAHWPTTAAIFLPGGLPPRVGETFVQSDLARTLQYMADQERAHAHGNRLTGLQAARDAFYRGDIAAAILRHQRGNGGWLTESDLAEFHSPIEPPCRIRF